MNKEKYCKKCSNKKPLTDFYKNKKCKDGHQYYCKVCQQGVLKTYYKNRKEEKAFEKFLDDLAGLRNHR